MGSMLLMGCGRYGASSPPPPAAPTITSGSSGSMPDDGSESIQFTATGDLPITWSTPGTPSGASLTSDGVLSVDGSLDDGSYTFEVDATNGVGSDSVLYTLNVVPSSPPPPPPAVHWINSSVTPGIRLGGYTGYVGGKFTPGGDSFTVNSVGFFILPGDGSNTLTDHVVQIQTVADNTVITQGTITRGTPVGSSGGFAYFPTGGITLEADTEYYILILLDALGDDVYITSNSSYTVGIGGLEGAYYSTDGPVGASFSKYGDQNTGYGPGDFTYIAP